MVEAELSIVGQKSLKELIQGQIHNVYPQGVPLLLRAVLASDILVSLEKGLKFFVF